MGTASSTPEQLPTEGIFVSTGQILDRVFGSFAEDVIVAFIPKLLTIIGPCLLLYFLVKGWMIMSGRARGGFADLILEIGLISFFIAIGLTTAHTFRYANEAVNWLQGVLMSGFSSSITLQPGSMWQWLQHLFDGLVNNYKACWAMAGKIFNFLQVGPTLLFGMTYLLGILGGAFYIFSICTMFVLNKIVITLLLAFTPVFFALGLFPVTREYLSNWVKTVIVYTLTLVFVLVVGFLFADVFSEFLEDVAKVAANAQKDKKGFMYAFIEKTFVLALMSFLMGYVIKQIPSITTGLVGKIVGAGAVTTSGTVVTDMLKNFGKAKDFVLSPSSSKSSDKKQSNAQRTAEAANSAGNEGLKSGASMASRRGGRSEGKAAQNANQNGDASNGGTKQAPPMSSFVSKANSSQGGSGGRKKGGEGSISRKGNSQSAHASKASNTGGSSSQGKNSHSGGLSRQGSSNSSSASGSGNSHAATNASNKNLGGGKTAPSMASFISKSGHSQSGKSSSKGQTSTSNRGSSQSTGSNAPQSQSAAVNAANSSSPPAKASNVDSSSAKSKSKNATTNAANSGSGESSGSAPKQNNHQNRPAKSAASSNINRSVPKAKNLGKNKTNNSKG